MATYEYARAKATIRGTVWYYIGYVSGRVVSFVSMLVLARILSQDDFGIAAYASIVISFIDVIAGLGINNAVIYNKEKEGIADTAFWINLVSSFTIFTLAWFSAPLMQVIFNDARSVDVLRILSIIYPISAFSYIQSALLQKRLSFGKRFIPTFVGSISKALISIPMALSGFGPWSLIIGQVGGEVLTTVTYWIVLPWRPKFIFKKIYVKPLMSYGINSVALDILSTSLNQIDFFFVGRYLGSAELGVYSLAFRIPEILIQMLCSAVASVLFPIFSSIQDDLDTLRRGFIKTTQYLFMIVVPLGVGLALVAKPLVFTFLSAKWIEAIPVIQAIAVYSTVKAVLYSAGILFKAQNKQIVITRISLFQLILAAPLLWWTIQTYHSIVYVAWVQVGVAVIIAVVQLFTSVRLIKISFRQIFSALYPPALAGICMSVVVAGVLRMVSHWPDLWQLIVSIGVGSCAYLLTIYLVQKDLILQIVDMIKSTLAARNSGESSS
jgi:PST family polysaccharide transporter